MGLKVVEVWINTAVNDGHTNSSNHFLQAHTLFDLNRREQDFFKNNKTGLFLLYTTSVLAEWIATIYRIKPRFKTRRTLTIASRYFF